MLTDEPRPTDSMIHARARRELEFNLGTFNVPTIVGLLAIIGMIWGQSATRATLDAQTQIRLDNIERDRVAARAANEVRMHDVELVTASVPNIVYRITVVEQGVVSTNARMDRMSDSINGVRDSVSEVGSKLAILTNRLEGLLPLRKTELLNEAPIPLVK